MLSNEELRDNDRSTRVVEKLLFPDWLLKHAPFKALRETHKAYKELEVSFDIVALLDAPGKPPIYESTQVMAFDSPLRIPFRSNGPAGSLKIKLS